MLVDTHCHLADEQFDADRAEVVHGARQAGVGHVIVIADSRGTTERAGVVAREYGWSATAGVHPHQASSWSVAASETIAAALGRAEVVAVGETGLDYHYDHAPRAVQREAFGAQLALAERWRKPIVVHARDADEDTVDLLSGWWDRVPAVVLHSFSSGDVLRDAGLAGGAYFSFSGMVTFKNWTRDEAIRRCPADRLLLETDAPYLAPHPYRGQRNEPAFVRLVAQRVAEVRGVSVEALVQTTTANAVRCFGPRVGVSERSA